MKKISVIIPMHNSAKHIKECIESVVNQTYKNIEIILVDDKSEDNTIEIANKIKDDRIKIIALQQNLGAANSRNRGIDESNRKLYLFFRFR